MFWVGGGGMSKTCTTLILTCKEMLNCFNKNIRQLVLPPWIHSTCYIWEFIWLQSRNSFEYGFVLYCEYPLTAKWQVIRIYICGRNIIILKLGHSKSYNIPQFMQLLTIPHPLDSYEDLRRISHLLLQADQWHFPRT